MLWLVGLPLHYEYDPHKANKQIVALGESNGREDGEVLLSLYLTHWTVLLLMQYWMHSEKYDVNIYSVTLFVIGVVCSHIVAYLLYIPFESQSYRLKVWMKKKLHVI